MRRERRLEKQDDLYRICEEREKERASKKSARGRGKKDDSPNEIIDHRSLLRVIGNLSSLEGQEFR